MGGVRRRLTRAATAAGLGLAVSAGAAGAATPPSTGGPDPGFPSSRLHVAVSGPRQADQALTIQATGANAAETAGLREVPDGQELIVTEPAILPGDCATGEQAELGRIAADRRGGSLLTYDELPEGDSGAFSLREPYEPTGSGPLQVCAYSESDHQDAAWAQADVRIAPAPVPPRARRRPVIARAGERLSCSRGTWTGAPRGFRYRWRVHARHFGPAHRGARFTLTAADRGATAVCEVIAVGAGGSGRATSRPLRLG